MNTSPDFDAQLLVEHAGQIARLESKLDGLTALITQRFDAHEHAHSVYADKKTSNRGTLISIASVLIACIALGWTMTHAPKVQAAQYVTPH
jgi:hypothetical protein